MCDDPYAYVPATPLPDVHWRCFYCGDVFSTAETAEVHFGSFEGTRPICAVGAEHYREMEAQLRSYQAEIDPASKTFYALGAKHAGEVRRAEEEGYNKGVRDGGALLFRYEEALRDIATGGWTSTTARRIAETALKVP